MTEKVEKVQYRLNLPQPLYLELKGMAEEKGTTVAELMRKGIQWQLLLDSIRENDGRVFIEAYKGAERVQVVTL